MKKTAIQYITHNQLKQINSIYWFYKAMQNEYDRTQKQLLMLRALQLYRGIVNVISIAVLADYARNGKPLNELLKTCHCKVMYE